MPHASARDDDLIREVVVRTAECIISLDEEGTVVFANHQVRDLLGYDADELIGTHVDELLPSTESPLERIRRAATDGAAAAGIDRVVMAGDDGEEILVRASVSGTEHDRVQYYTLTLRPTDAPDSAPDPDSGSNTDTDSEGGPGASGEAEGLIRAMLGRTSDAALVVDLDTNRIVDCSRRACDLLGHTRAELLSGGSTEDGRDGMKTLQELLERTGGTNGLPLDLDSLVEETDVELGPEEAPVSVVEVGGRSFVLATVRDSPANWTPIEDHHEHDCGYRRFVDRLPEACFFVTTDGTVTHWNEGAERRHNLASQEVLGEPLRDLFPSLRDTLFEERLETAMETGDRIEFEWYCDPTDDHLCLRMLPSENGTWVFSEEINDRKRRQHERGLFRAVLDQSSDGVFVIDPETTEIVDANGAACRQLGYSWETLLGKSIAEISAGEDGPERAHEYIERVREEGACTLEGRYRRAEGDTFPVEVSADYVSLNSQAVDGPFEGREYVLAIARDVSEHRERERELRELSEEYEALMGNVEDVVFVVDVEASDADPEFRFERLSHTHGDKTGLNPETFEGATPREALGEEIGAEVEANYRRCVEAGEPITYEEDLDLPGGRTAWQTSLAPVIVDGEVTRIVGVAREMTDRVERERELREARERLQRIFDHSNDMILLLDPVAGEFRQVNATACETLGYTEPELLSLDPEELHPHEPEKFERFVDEVLEEGTSWTDDFSCRTCEGELIPSEMSASCIEFDGDPHVLALVRDVTERKERERQLETYETMVETFGGGVYVLDDEYRFTAVNDGMIELTGYDREELLGMPLSELLVGEARDDPAAYEDYLSGDMDSVLDAGSMRETRRSVREDDTDVVKVECPIRTADGDILPCEDRFSALDTEAGGTAGVFVDTSDLVERRRRIRRHAAALDAANDGIALIDEDGCRTYVNDAFLEMYGYDSREEVLGRKLTAQGGPEWADKVESEILPAVRETGSWRGEATAERTDGSTFSKEVSVSELEGGGIVCVVRDVTERKEHERRLNALHEASQELTRAAAPGEIADAGIEAVRGILGYDIGCLRILNETTNSLEPVAMTDAARELVDGRPAFDLEATLAGRAFRRGELVRNEPETTEPYEDALARASLHLPLGDHGVLTVFSLGLDGFAWTDCRLAEVLASSVAAHLDRAEREQAIIENERELRRQHDELETLNGVNRLVQDLTQELIDIKSREEIEAKVCARLADSEIYRSAWMAEVDVAGETLEVKTGTGLDDGYLEALGMMSVGSIHNGIVEQTIENREVSVTRQYLLGGETSASATSGEAVTDGTANRVESAAAIPLQCGDRLYGVLVLTAAGEDVFGPTIQRGLAALGDIVGFVINAVQNEELLLADHIVKLEFSVTDPGCFAVALSAELGCQCYMEQSMRTGKEGYLSYVRLEGIPPEEALPAVRSMDVVTDCRVVNDREGGGLIEVRRSDCGATSMMDFGATITSVEATDGEGTVVIEAPRSVDVRKVVNAYQERNPQSELVAKREEERSVRTVGDLREAVGGRLTDRQATALRTAYAAGYFDWPRESTAEEVAESMGIASSTLHQHLRRAEHELLTAFLGDGYRHDGLA